MRKVSHISWLYTCFFFLMTTSLKAQTEYLSNPSLDGDNTEKTLTGWETCEYYNPLDTIFYYNSNPDFLDFYTDTVYKDTLYHKDGINMCLLRARGVNISFSKRRGTFERISTKLLLPFEKDSSYTLTIWLIHMHNVQVADLVDPNVSFPLRFQVFGTDGYCTADANDTTDKLADTLVKNEEWKKYVFHLKPTSDYDYIYFRVYWDDSITVSQNGLYNGFIFIDGANLFKGSPDPSLHTSNYTISENFLIYPNPSKNQVTITTDKESVVDIYSISGNHIFRGITSNNTLFWEYNLPKGVYLVRITDRNRQSTVKLLRVEP